MNLLYVTQKSGFIDRSVFSCLCCTQIFQFEFKITNHRFYTKLSSNDGLRYYTTLIAGMRKSNFLQTCIILI